ncbi:MAG: flagellar hook-associated protein FlgK [Longimicrobiales bacterium]
MSAPLSGILSNAKSGLLAHQLALQVTSHNLANATTEGYSRQRAELVPGTPLLTTQGLLGTGVRVADITRARDSVLDSVFRRESSLYHGLTAQHDALLGVELSLGEPGPTSLGATLGAFWDSWSDLANDPISSTARVAVVARGNQLVEHFHRVDAALDAFRTQMVDKLQTSLAEINRIVGEVADLNARIASASAVGVSAPDLEDRQDALIDELARYVPVVVTARTQGGVGVSVEGISVVEGSTHQTLSASAVGGIWSVATSGGLVPPIAAGEVGGALKVLNDDFAVLRAGLDRLAQGIVERVNGIHATGTNSLGATGVRFFDDFGNPATVTARTFSLDAAILADNRAVSAGTPDGTGAYQAGENDVALALAGLRYDTAGGVLAGTSVDDAYRDLATALSVSVASSREALETHETLVAAARERRESVSGVTTDEELIHVVQIQAAFAAASRLVSTVDEMYETLLAI